MERVVGQPLAEKPDFSSVLRCRWGSGRRFEPVLVLAVLLQVRRSLLFSGVDIQTIKLCLLIGAADPGNSWRRRPCRVILHTVLPKVSQGFVLVCSR